MSEIRHPAMVGAVALCSSLGILIAAAGWMLSGVHSRIDGVDQRLERVEAEVNDVHRDVGDLKAEVARNTSMLEQICRRLLCGMPPVTGVQPAEFEPVACDDLVGEAD